MQSQSQKEREKKEKRKEQKKKTWVNKTCDIKGKKRRLSKLWPASKRR
jgi:hypothetical protein